MATLWHQELKHGRDWIPAGTTVRYSFQLYDDTGSPITLTQLTTVTLTIYSLETRPPVPMPGTWPRDLKNVSANGGSVSSSGLLTVVIPSTDNVLIDPTNPYESVRWAFRWTHTSGTKTQYAEVDRVISRTV